MSIRVVLDAVLHTKKRFARSRNCREKVVRSGRAAADLRRYPPYNFIAYAKLGPISLVVLVVVVSWCLVGGLWRSTVKRPDFLPQSATCWSSVPTAASIKQL